MEVPEREIMSDANANASDEEVVSTSRAANVVPTEATTTTTPSSCSSSSTPLKVAAVMDEEQVNPESVYHFYQDQLLPSLMASLPILLLRIRQDMRLFLSSALHRFVQFLLPSWWTQEDPVSLPQLWWQEQQSQAHEGSSLQQLRQQFPDFMIRYFDADGDGHISRAELLNMTEIIKAHFPVPQHPSWWVWFSREWPLMDWKVGVFLWKTFGGILLLLTVLTIIPGTIHGWTARILRWPVLALTYFLILVELMVYVVIRLAIRIAEDLIARPKHRRLRRQLAKAQSYAEWYALASELDRSQKRDKWLRRIDDPISSRYNWGFVLELLKDLRAARERKESILALAVLQQCTRKNVGGVMSEDLFSYSNTGEPKYVVTEFVQEVARTIRWVAEEAMKAEPADLPPQAEKVFDARLQQEVRNEKDKLWKSLFDATLQFATGHGHHEESCHDSNGDDKSHISRSASEDSRNKKDSNHGITPIQETNVTKAHHSSSNSSISSNGSGRVASSPSQQQMPQSPVRSLPLTTQLHRAEVLAFLKRARAAYGRTALCLSGGAMMGLYHLGHLVGLLETGTLPHIISGTSAGSAIAALLCTRTDDELRRDMKPEVLQQKFACFRSPWLHRMKCLWRTGNLFEVEEWLSLLKWFTCDDMTFEEAYKKTGRVFCITLSSTTKKAPPVLLNYLTAPNVVIASACLASGAVPGFIPPVRLQYKNPDGTIRGPTREREETYFDGSIRQDIPVNGLAEMLNCQFFVVCQANPHIVPFFFGNKGGVGRPSRWSSGMQESSWRGGFLLAALEMYLKNDMKAKFVFLNDLEAAIGFTSTLMTQEFVGTTTIVPQVSFLDYFRLFRNPKLDELYNYFQVGAVASYEHVAMIKLHYTVADVLDECVAMLEGKSTKGRGIRKRSSVKIPDCRAPKPKVVMVKRSESELAFESRPSILSLIMGTNESGEQADAHSNETHEDTSSVYDEYTRDWIDIE